MPQDRNAALIVIDVQRGFDDDRWGRRNNPQCEANVERLLGAWRTTGEPVVVVRHDSVEPDSPLRPDRPGNELKEVVRGPHDLLVRKSVNSAFYGDPDLHRWLQERGIDTLVVCGITTNHCCESTVRMAGNLGYKVLYPIDATFTFDMRTPWGEVVPAEDLARATAASLHGEFATVLTTEELLRPGATGAGG